MHWRNPRRVRRRASGRTVAYNLRFPGQIFDGQAGLHQNGRRDFDPAVGRYVESDPIGLNGGINTYGYALSDPMLLYDPSGLWVPPSIPDGLYNFSLGVVDDLSFGIGPIARSALGINGGENRCSTAYKAGQYAALAAGLGRIAYAGAAKAIAIGAANGAEAAASRNLLKQIFRGPFAGSDYRIYSYDQLLEKYGSDAAIRDAAGRTSPLVNAIGVDAGAGGVANAASCGCK
jgi:RHS repeat-associated protein